MNNRIMKSLSLGIGFTLITGVVLAQDRFTNLGNVHVFSGASVAFFGDFANDGTFTDDGGTITFKGSADQTISGTSPVTFYGFSVNNAAGVSLQQNITVGNLLTLTAGPFDLNATH
jgi:MSHA biogenesis protein MshQ